MYTKETAEVLGSNMEMLLFEPQGAGPFPGLVVAQHIPVAHTGLERDPFTLDVGERLAAAGYAVIIPYVFHWWPADEDIAVKRELFRDDWALADLGRAYATLEARDKVDGRRIGIIGHCWGGRLAWLGACRNPTYKAAVVLYGGRIKLAMADGGVPPIELADHIRCPVLGIFGNDDQNPTPADVDDLDAALTRAGVAHEFHRYDRAGHGFQDFNDNDRYRKEAADDAWRKILSFLARELRSK